MREPAMASSPHDAIFKATFGQPELARSELEFLLPAEVREHLDLRTLTVCPGSFIDEELQQTHSDLLFATRTISGGPGLVYVLFEHQSSPDGTMAFRLLRYVVRVWERWLRDHPDARTLPIVLPVLLHHGDNAWSATPDLASMLDATPELLEATRPFVPHFRFLLDDLAALSVGELASRSLDPLPRLVQLALWASRSLPRLERAKPFMRAVTEALVGDAHTRALLRQIFGYVFAAAAPDVEASAIRSILFEIAGAEGKEDVMNAGEQLRVEGDKRTIRDAIARVLGARSVVVSDVGRARLAACDDVPTLTEWLTRAATASSEAEVFASESA